MPGHGAFVTSTSAPWSRIGHGWAGSLIRRQIRRRVGEVVAKSDADSLRHRPILPFGAFFDGGVELSR
jgi:hypothetical protein